MNQQLISIRHIASTGSIREAAALLGRNPSTLTRGLKSVENELNSQELEKMMLSHKVDFCIMHFQKALEKVCYDEFSDDPFYLAVPESFQSQVALPEGKQLKAEDIRQLKKIPFVMVASRQKLRQVADEILICGS